MDVTRRQHHQHQQQHSNNSASLTSSHSQPISATAHPLLLRQLKGHSEHCTAVAFGHTTITSTSTTTTSGPTPTRHLLAVSSRDRLVRVWHLDDLDSGGRAGSDVVNVKLRADFATALCFCSANSQLYCVLSDTNTVDAYDTAVDGKLTVTFSRSFPIASRDTVTTAHCTANRLLLLMSRGTDTPVLVYSSSGSLLRSVAINQLRNHELACSSSGRFFAAATKLSDVKVWGVGSDRSGGATSTIEHVMTLSGHSKAVQAVCFPDDETACTITAGGRIACFNIKVRYAEREEVKLRWTCDTHLPTEPFAMRCSLCSSPASSSPSSSWLLAVGCATEVRLYRASPAGCHELHVISDVGGQWGLAAMELSADGKRMITFNSAAKTAEYWRVPGE